MKSKIIFLALVALLQIRCSNNDNSSPTNVEFISSAWISILDINGRPLQDASVELGDQIGLTDVEGHYFFRNVSMNDNTFLKVEKVGFFSGSRRFYPAEEKINYIDIILLPLTQVGSFNTSSGATMDIDSKSNLIFPNDAIVDANNAAYSGNVHVMAYPIYADDPNLSKKMPGDLVGIDLTGNSGMLNSLGMLSVELEADNGSKLQIAPGKLAEMQIQIPDNMVVTAPVTISMWYFDDVSGYWKEEGQANKVGNKYIAHVGHFSTWNCDNWERSFRWNASFVYESGIAVAGVEICLTMKRLNTTNCGRTNDDGTISCYIPANEPLVMEINNPCGTAMFSKEIGPYAQEPSIYYSTLQESIMLPNTISGSVIDCNAKPIKKGFIRVNAGENHYVFNLDHADGIFDNTFLSCENTDISIVVFDEANAMMSLPLTFDDSTSIETGPIKVCETLDEFIRFRVNGFAKESVFHFPRASVSNDTYITTSDTIGPNGTFTFAFDGISTGVYPSAGGSRVNLPNGEYGFVLDMEVTVSYFGGPGDFIKGSFTGRINAGGNGAGGPGYSDFAGTFSVRRNP